MTDYLTTTQAARRIGVARSTVHRWVVSGALPATHTALGVLLAPDDVERARAWKERKVGGSPP